MIAAIGLAACSGGVQGASQSSEKQETVVAAPSDEDLIRADIGSIVGTSVSKEALSASFRTDSQMVEFEKIGMDIDAYAEAFSKKCKLEIDFIEVKSDTAVAKVTFTTPRLDDEAEKLLDEALDAELENVNIENASEEELFTLLFGIMQKTIESPDFPLGSESFDIEYTKTNGTWSMVDQSFVESSFFAAAASAANV